MVSYKQNKLQILCRGGQNRLVQCWSNDNGGTWGKIDTSGVPNANADADIVTLQNGWQLMVYNPCTKDETSPVNRRQLSVAISRDGQGWEEIMQLEGNSPSEEFTHPSVLQTTDGDIHVMYTCNKKNIKHVVLRESKSYKQLTASANL